MNVIVDNGKTYANLSDLKEWEKNPRAIKDKDFQLLKDQITLLGQYKPLLVMNDGTVLGGNMRLKAYKESGGFDKLWVSIIEFIEKDGLFYAVINGQEQKKPFESILQGMTEYSLSDNDRAGFYQSGELANLVGETNIDPGIYHIDFSEPLTLEGVSENTGEGQGGSGKEFEVTCPNCGTKFNPKGGDSQ